MLALSLIGTGITLGIVHVLAGLDHLSALATLCACESTRTSFFLGLQWGIGHSAGLLLVGGIFIAIVSTTTTTTTTTTPNGDTTSEEHVEIPETVTKVFENLVGAFMIALGIYGLHRAYRRHKQNQEEDSNTRTSTTTNNNNNNTNNISTENHEDNSNNDHPPTTTTTTTTTPPKNLLDDDVTPTGDHNHPIEDADADADAERQAGIIETHMTTATTPTTPRDPTIIVMEDSKGTAIVRTRRVGGDTTASNIVTTTNNNNNDDLDYDEEDPYMPMVDHRNTEDDTTPTTGPPPATMTLPTPPATTTTSGGWSVLSWCRCCCCWSSANASNNNSACFHRCLALFAGLVHGVAGPGGVLGVIPAVQIRNPWLGTLYLSTFCISSTLTMGCFAAFYGKLFKKSGWEFRIECASAFLSLAVGILWLVLLGTGKMDAVFGE